MKLIEFLKGILVLLVIGIYPNIFFSQNKETVAEKNDVPVINFSVIIIIHGDSDYLYHTGDGTSLQADQNALKNVQDVAKSSNEAEFFIFHQKPLSKSFFIFSEKNGSFFYYKNGILKASVDYYTDYNNHLFSTEKILFDKYSNNDNAKHYFFVYYGHQIPEYGVRGYYRSKPNLLLNVKNFYYGIYSFIAKYRKSYDLLLLSTCNNGTPGVISYFSNIANYIIASPCDLHLSYIDIDYFRFLSENNYNQYSFAHSLANDAFTHLKNRTETIVTISLYNSKKLKDELKEINPKYLKYVTAKLNSNSLRNEFSDCSETNIFNTLDINDGVEVFYRAPSFGPQANKKSFSGWGCP